MKRIVLTTIAVAAFVGACQSTGSTAEPSAGNQPESKAEKNTSGTQVAQPPADGLAVATFAGGCFWCMEPPFDEVPGVKSTTSGYTGGKERHPTYKDVAYGRTGHTESIQVVFDPQVVTYEQLLDVFWRNIDPTDAGGQFVDRGSQYRTAIFVHDAKQRNLAELSKNALRESGRFKKTIVTAIHDAGDFWVAEAYHQDFYKKSPRRYYSYRRGSGRDDFIARTWGVDQ